MKRALFVIGTGLLVLGSAVGSVHAGRRNAGDVVVGAGSASGSTGGARNSAGTSQEIGCTISGYSASSTRVTCRARNAAGTFVTCSSTAAGIVAAATGLSSDSYISFFFGLDGVCTQLNVITNSAYEPKQP